MGGRLTLGSLAMDVLRSSAVPYPWGANPLTVLGVTLGIEVLYMTYAIWQFSGLALWKCAVRVTVVLAVGYALLIGLIGADRVAHILLPALQLRR